MAGSATDSRLRDSLETAFTKGRGRCCAFIEEGSGVRGQASECAGDHQSSIINHQSSIPLPSPLIQIDGRPWRRIGFSTQLACEDCGIEYPPPEPRLYSFNSPLGACPECEGFGNVIGHGHGPDRSRPGQVAPRGGDCPVEHAGLRPRVERVAGAGQGLRPARGRAVPRVVRASPGLDCARRAGAEVWRPGRLFRLAGAAEIQDAHPRVLEPLAELPAVSGVRRHAAAARGALRPASAAGTSARSAR